MSEQENIRIVRKTFENLNSHNLHTNDQLLADNVQTIAPAVPTMTGRDQGRMYIQRFVDAFKDLRFEVRDVVAQGDKVAATWVSTGTHSGALPLPTGDSIPPTNKRVTVPGCTIFEFKGDLITRQEIYWDQVTFLNQLGVMQQMSQSSRPNM